MHHRLPRLVSQPHEAQFIQQSVVPKTPNLLFNVPKDDAGIEVVIPE